MIIKILRHLMTFSDKTLQLFLNRKKTPQLSFQYYKPSTYKPLTYVTLRHVIKVDGLFHMTFS